MVIITSPVWLASIAGQILPPPCTRLLRVVEFGYSKSQTPQFRIRMYPSLTACRMRIIARRLLRSMVPCCSVRPRLLSRCLQTLLSRLQCLWRCVSSHVLCCHVPILSLHISYISINKLSFCTEVRVLLMPSHRGVGTLFANTSPLSPYNLRSLRPSSERIRDSIDFIKLNYASGWEMPPPHSESRHTRAFHILYE